MSFDSSNFSEANEKESTIDPGRYSFSLQYSDQPNKLTRYETEFLPEFSGDNDIEINNFSISNSDLEKFEKAFQELDENLNLLETKTNKSGGSDYSSDGLDSNTNTPVRAKQIGDYLLSNFSDIDFDKNDRLDSGELKFSGEFFSPTSRFVNDNYYALKSLSDDDYLSDKGISKKDISMLYGNERPEISTGDAVGAVLEGIGRSASSILKATGVAAAGSLIFCPPCAVPVTGVAFFGSTIGVAGGKLYSLNRQLKQVDEIYQPKFVSDGWF